MIYLFNESKTLFSIVSREELLSFLYEREVNALYQASVEMPVQSTDKNGLSRNLYNEMQNATYFGHYDLNDKFQLHKIVTIDVTGDSFITTAVHLFFDEAKALAVTEERRFIDRPIEDSVIYAFGLIGWTLDEYDVSDAKTVSFFNDTVLEAQAKIIKTFGFKFDYWLDFDGQKITSKKVKVKEELGVQTHQRYVYGHNTLGIKMETDFSEIYTAVLGRGHGERIENLDVEGNETEDTFGRRIEFDEVEWSKSSGDPLDKDLGERILVDPVSTQIFGYVREDDTVAPRVKVVEFSDIEDEEELIQASYDWLMENNSPKAVYSVEVLETEELDLGDEVYVVYRDIDFVKSARVSRVVDDLLSERRAVEFGDSDYFRRNSETSRLQRELQDTKNDSADYIQDLIRQSNARIDAEMQQARDDFEQALIVAQAEIDAAEQRMADLIGGVRDDFDTEFNAEIERIEQEAQQEYNDIRDKIESDISNARSEIETDYNAEIERIEQEALIEYNRISGEITDSIGQARSEIESEFEAEVERVEQEAIAEYVRISGEITDSIGQARSEIEEDYNQAVTSAREYAEQQAVQHANVVDGKLETMRGIHAGLIDDVSNNIVDINDFLGARDKTLQLILDEQRTDLERKIELYNRTHPNLQVGTTFENIQGWRPWQGRQGELELRTDEALNFVRIHPDGSNTPSMESLETITLEADKHYVVAVDFRSDVVNDLDNSYFLSSSGNVSLSTSQTRGLIADSTWHRYYFDFDMTGRESTDYKLMLGTGFNYGDTDVGTFDLRQIHVYEGTDHGIPWSPSPSDNQQIVSQLLYEMRELEDGMSSLATKTEFNILTGNVTQLTNEYTSTSALVSSKLQSFDDLLGDNGSHFTQVADQVQSKVWLNDIHNPNLLSYTNVHLLDDRQKWNRWNVSVTGSAYDDEYMWIRNTDSLSTIGIRSPKVKIEAGRTYTLSWVGLGNDNMNMGMNYCYVFYDVSGNRSLALPRRTVIPTSPNQYNGRTVYKFNLTFEGHYSESGEVMIGGYTRGTGLDVSFFVKEPKLELGDRATSYYTAFSGITQRISEIELLTQEIDGGVLRQSDITVSPSSVRIGSTEILGDDVLASVLNVSPSAIDMITQKMRLSGDLYVDGDITALAISAVEGEFSRLWATEFDAVTITAQDISGFSARFSQLYTLNANIESLTSQIVFTNAVKAKAIDAVEANIGSLFASTADINFITAGHLSSNSIKARHLTVDSALIDKLSASSIFTDMLTAKTISAVEGNFADLITVNLETHKLRARHINANAIGADHLYVDSALINKLSASTIFTNMLSTKTLDAIDANVGSVRTSLLTSNVITSGMIQSSNATINKLFSNNARIDTLISKTHFVDEIHTMSLDAVYADIAHLRSELITANVITSDHIKVENALINKLFATSALIERLTTKTAFISQLRTIDLAADQVRVGFNGISNNVTINSSGITIDKGALTVKRNDGGVPTIVDGVNPSGIALFPATPHRRDSGFTTQGQYAVRESGADFMIYDFYMFEWFYSDLMLDFAIYNFETHDIRVRVEVLGTDGSTFSRAVDYTVPYTDVRVAFPRMILNLGAPDGSVQRFFIRVRNVGSSSQHGKFGIHTYMVKHLDNGHGYPRLEDNGLPEN